MKRNVKHLLAIAMSLLMLLGSVTGAVAEFNETGLPICDEEVTLSMMYINDYTKDSGNTWLFKWIRENMGLNIVVENYPNAVIATQYAVRMDSNDLPDLCWFSSGYEENAEFFLDFKPYIEAGLMPNVVKWFEEHPDAERAATLPDGSIRGFGNTRTDNLSRLVRMDLINTQWLRNVNMDMPETLDELTEVLRAFRDQDADGDGDPDNEIPLSFTLSAARTGERMDWTLRSCFGIDSTSSDYLLQADEEGNVYLAETTENYKAYLEYLNMLFEEKLLDNELYTQNDAEYKEKLANHQVGVFDSWGSSFDFLATNDEEMKAVGQNFAWFAPVLSDYNDDRNLVLYNGAARALSGVAASKTEYGEIIARFIDYWFSEEGAILFWYGIEGETFDWKTSEAGLKTPDFSNYYAATGYSSSGDYLVEYLRPENFTCWYVYSPANRQAAAEVKAGNRAALENYLNYADSVYEGVLGLGLLDYGTCDCYPGVSYTSEMRDKLNAPKTDIANYIKTMKCQFITGELDIEEDWDTFQETLSSMNVEQIIEIEQEAYNNYYGK